MTPKDKLKPGTLVRIAGTVRNLGAGSSDRLEVALFLAVPGTAGKELIRQTIASPGMMTDSPFEFVWPAAPGNHSLRVVADPDSLLGESNRKNNAAIVGIVVPGDDAPPKLTVVKPQQDLTTPTGAVSLLATATDEAGIIGVDVSVDGGMVKPLYRTSNGFEGVANLQPGTHSLRFKVTDSGGLQVEEARTVKVEATRPQCKIIIRSQGAAIDTPDTRVLISASDVAQVCVRVNGGPWLQLQPTGQMWGGRMDLPFGPCQIEVVAINAAGVRQTQAVTANCTAQPEKEKQDEPENQPQKKPGLADGAGQDRDAKGDPESNTAQGETGRRGRQAGTVPDWPASWDRRSGQETDRNRTGPAHLGCLQPTWKTCNGPEPGCRSSRRWQQAQAGRPRQEGPERPGGCACPTGRDG